MSNNERKISILKELIYNLYVLPSSFIENKKFYREEIKIIYDRSINFAQEINYPNYNQRINLVDYFIKYYFFSDSEWQIAKDKLGLFLADMLDYVNDDVSKQANFWNLIHKNVVEVSMKKFENGHYADSVESAYKDINKRVKDIVQVKTGNEIDGVSLMREAFNSSKNKVPLILLDDISRESGRNIQEGYMQLFAGSMQGIRNPKAHDNINITKDRAIHQIFLASLLMYKLDEGKI